MWNVTFERDQAVGPNHTAAIAVHRRVHKVVFDNVRVTNPDLTDNFLDNDGPWENDPHPIVEIRNCTLNGSPVTLANCGGNLTNVVIIND